MTSPRIQIPQRFESLKNLAEDDKLATIVRPVRSGLAVIQQIYDDMLGAGQGAFLVLQGPPGSGKSTFLHTLKLFLDAVTTITIDAELPVEEAILETPASAESLRVFILRGREDVATLQEAELDRALHGINEFIRSREGLRTLVVWPCNSPEAARRILAKARLIGGDALLGFFPDGYSFEGLPKSEYLDVARGTIQALNGGATLLAAGITEERALELARGAPTIGAYLQSLRHEEQRNRTTLANHLAERERYNLWVVVIAGNDPETEVGTLTHGAHFSADIERLLASTDANVVQDLRRYPAKLGLLGRTFDARVLFVPFMTAVRVVQDHAGDELRAALIASGFPARTQGDGLDRLRSSQLARALRSEPVALRPPGRPPEEARRNEFRLLSQHARADDGALNRAVADALVAAGLIQSYTLEAPLGATQARSADVLCRAAHTTARLEFMWRASTTTGEIARYVLEKLYNYGRAIGFLNGS
jgi:hypothetical protein